MLHQIAEKFSDSKEKIEAFFAEHTANKIPLPYLSCDIRNSGKKLGVIDTNLFPAGFNNLCNAYSEAAATSFRNYFNKYYPTIKKILLLSEEHTRNRFYLENIFRLQTLLQEASLECRVGFLGQSVSETHLELAFTDERVLKMDKISRSEDQIQLGDWTPDLILSNNDFSQEIPEVLMQLKTPLLPPPHLGWHQRRKSDHFTHLQKWVDRFAEYLDLDPWLLSCLFQKVPVANLSERAELEKLSEGVEQTIQQIEKKYIHYKVDQAPYVFIKNNAGTYGMGLLDVSEPEEVLQLNRRQRNKLLSAKGGQAPNEFLIQEGIPTADFYSGLPIEPVIYMVGWEVVGGFFRMNPERTAQNSLNTRGMIFSCLCLHKIDEPHEDAFLNCVEKANLVKLSTVMARLAALAAVDERAS